MGVTWGRRSSDRLRTAPGPHPPEARPHQRELDATYVEPARAGTEGDRPGAALHARPERQPWPPHGRYANHHQIAPGGDPAQPEAACSIHSAAGHDESLAQGGRCAAELLPVLPAFGGPAEQRAIAEVLFARLTSGGGAARLEHVGGLASVTLTPEEIRADRRLVTLEERVRARPGAAAIPVLGSADIATVKPQVIVRTPGAYGRRVLLAVVLDRVTKVALARTNQAINH